MSLENELKEIKIMLSSIQMQLNSTMEANESKVYKMAELKKLFNVKRHETVMKRIQELDIHPLPSRHLQVTEKSLRKAGML